MKGNISQALTGSISPCSKTNSSRHKCALDFNTLQARQRTIWGTLGVLPQIVLVTVFTAVINHHWKATLREKGVYFNLQPTGQHPEKSGQELKAELRQRAFDWGGLACSSWPAHSAQLSTKGSSAQRWHCLPRAGPSPIDQKNAQLLTGQPGRGIFSTEVFSPKMMALAVSSWHRTSQHRVPSRSWGYFAVLIQNVCGQESGH